MNREATGPLGALRLDLGNNRPDQGPLLIGIWGNRNPACYHAKRALRDLHPMWAKVVLDGEEIESVGGAS